MDSCPGGVVHQRHPGPRLVLTAVVVEGRRLAEVAAAAPVPRSCPGSTTAGYALSVTAHRRVSGPIVVAAFQRAVAVHGLPASVLSDKRHRALRAAAGRRAQSFASAWDRL
jgi:hypothetical protein